MYPSSLPGERNSRVRVDSELGSFYSGTQFRTFKEISLAAGATLNLKMTRPVDIVVRGFHMDVSAGELRCEVYRNPTVGGTWNNPLPIIGKCEFSDNPPPLYVPQCAILTGGTFTGGTLYDLMYVKTSGAAGQASTVGDSIDDNLGIPSGSVGVYSFINTGNSQATAVFRMWWEELPVK